MKINNSSDFDLDLFFFYEDFPCIYHFITICHFATGGLQISDENFFTKYHNDFRNQILNNNTVKFEYRLNPNLEKIIANKREIDLEFNLENYTRDFIRYAQYGLFSFDRTNLHDSKSDYFHLVAYPIINEYNIDKFLDYFMEHYFHFLNYDLAKFNLILNRDYIDIHEFIRVNFQKSVQIKM